jgi:hypothetical protein
MRPTYLAAFLLRWRLLPGWGSLRTRAPPVDAALKISPTIPTRCSPPPTCSRKGAGDEGLKKAVDLYKKALTVKGVSQLRAYYGLAWAQERLNLLPDAPRRTGRPACSPRPTPAS